MQLCCRALASRVALQAHAWPSNPHSTALIEVRQRKDVCGTSAILPKGQVENTADGEEKGKLSCLNLNCEKVILEIKSEYGKKNTVLEIRESTLLEGTLSLPS